MSGKKWTLAAVAGLLVVVLAAATSVYAQGTQNPGGNGAAVPGVGACGSCGGATDGGAGMGMMGRGMGMRFGGQGGLVALVAEELGVDSDEVVAALESGDTLAEFVEAKGGSVETIIDAFIAQRQDALDQAVEAGRLTEEQAAAMVERMRVEVEEHLQGESDMPCLDGASSGLRRGPGTQGQPDAQGTPGASDDIAPRARGRMGIGRF